MSPDRDPAPDRSLPARERLRLAAEFREVFDEGTSFHGPSLVLFLLRRDGLDRKVGVVAGRRVGGAVVRNRCKRLLREAYRHLKHRLSPTGLHLVLVARRGCDTHRMQAVHDELERLLRRAGVLDDPGDRLS